ncbi:MAG: imidazolonepropionase, partial [Gammaproteobacteria bacterium]|nr:imidazolonepropionase [Gammaproteobacteria bacterium]
NVNLATMVPGEDAYGVIENGAIAVAGGRITWLGKEQDLPDAPGECALEVLDGTGSWVTPGLIDCHTHIVYGGNRAAEFEMRLEGASYEEIARAGGGIRSTVSATRAASEQELVESARERVQQLLAEGVTTLEIKSGYGLEPETELRMLRVARYLGKQLPVDIHSTFLGAHALPAEYEGGADQYISLVCEEMLPRIEREKLADAVDAFCENIGFTAAQVERVFQKAADLQLPVKLHADQLSDGGGALLAARYNALSADHIEFTSEPGIAAMAEHGTVAVLLPGAFYFLRETQLPPIQLCRQYGVPIAIASDSNPGSSPARSLLLIMNMACTLFRLTPAEALAGVTRNAAIALGIAADKGTLAVGKRADLVFWNIGKPAELCYWIGGNPCQTVVKDGAIL